MTHRRLAVLLVPALALAVSVGPAPGAAAGPSDGPHGTTAVSPLTPDVAAAARRTSTTQAVAAHWTPELLAAATPVPLSRRSGRDLARAAKRTEPAPFERVSRPTGPSGVQARATPFSRVAGKVFFLNRGDPYVCSGAALNSPSGTLVSTAGHCVHDGRGATRGRYYSNWVFIPGYTRGRRPHGTFAAEQFTTLAAWRNHGSSARGFNADVALVRVGPNADGQTVVEAVGGNGLAVGGRYDLKARLFGYPGNLDGGEVQKTCAKRLVRYRWQQFSYRRANGCGFGGGASGGPWVAGYDRAAGAGVLRGVSSFGPSDGAYYLASPYFGDAVRTLYQRAESAAQRSAVR